MAAGAVILFNLAKRKAFEKLIDFDNDTFKVALCHATQVLTAAFAGTSTDARYADLTDEATTAGGYTAGGVTLTGVGSSTG